ncbi:MAG: TetR/AcrR family transcriptional regulator, partial [Cyanobacteria bacterium J06649_5]
PMLVFSHGIASSRSEASIFKRFSTKETLFLKSMGLTDELPWLLSLEDLVGQGALKENLKVIGLQIIEFFQENLPKIIMLMSKGIFAPANMMGSENAPPVRNLKALTIFFETEMKLGRMKSREPRAVEMQFMGSFMNYVMLSQMSAPLPKSEDYVESVIESFWQGVKP